MLTSSSMKSACAGVASISATISYYSDVLGFDLITTYGSQAAFLAVDGYHHQLGANTWQSEGGRPPAPHEASLRHVEIVLPTTATLSARALLPIGMVATGFIAEV